MPNSNKTYSKNELYERVVGEIVNLEYDYLKDQPRQFNDKLVTCSDKLGRLSKGHTHEFQKEIKRLNQNREQGLEVNYLNYKYKLKLAETLYEAEVEKIEKEFETEVQNTRSTLLGELEAKVLNLKDDKDGIDVRNGDSTSRNFPTTRRHRKRFDNESGRSKRKGQLAQAQPPSLNTDQITDDIKRMRGLP